MSAELPTSDAMAERIGTLANKCDNMYAASSMPLSAEVHLPILRRALLDLRNDLRALHVAITGDNPWQ
jgi:hypothetical protein